MTLDRRSVLASAAVLAGAAGLGRADAAPDNRVALKAKRAGLKPNIVVIVLDDVGYADLGCYGSELKTPAVDALAASGLRLRDFHVTALCAPTRACLLTGINAHAVGVGNIAEWGRSLPAYSGVIDRDVPLMSNHLRDRDYATFAVGKWHLAPMAEQNAQGPFDHWPTRRGFDHWYGFHASAADHWHPELYEDLKVIDAPQRERYHLTEDLIDRSIGYLQAAADGPNPDQPVFLYVALGACHFPYHVPKSYLARHRGRYGDGYTVLRQRRLERQIELGLIPADTVLPDANEDVQAWAEVEPGARAVSATIQEAYAAFLEHTDAQIARLIAHLRAAGKLDDTLVVVMSDNGGGPGGKAAGQFDVRQQSYASETVADVIGHLGDIGSPASYCRYGPGWAQASNTPFRYYKSNTYAGGTTAPLIFSWPRASLPEGQMLPQYAHAVDVLPTLLDLIDGGQPRARAKRSLQGVSFANALRDPLAPSLKAQQIFETSGDRAIWQNGWRAVVKHRKGGPFSDDRWALYHTAVDFNERIDLATKHPEKLAELVHAWAAEAGRQQILPLSDEVATLMANNLPAPKSAYRYTSDSARVDRLSTPPISRYASVFDASFTAPMGGASGCIFACGDAAAGYELFVDGGMVTFVYAFTRWQHFAVSAPLMQADRHRATVRIVLSEAGAATIALAINGSPELTMTVGRLWPITSLNAGFRCGRNTGAPISGRYVGPAPVPDVEVGVRLDLT